MRYPSVIKVSTYKRSITQNQAVLRPCRFESGLRHQYSSGFSDFSEIPAFLFFPFDIIFDIMALFYS